MTGPRQIVEGFWSAQHVRVCLRLGVPDILPHANSADEGLTAEEVASKLNTDPVNTYRLLRALSVPRLVSENADNRFTLTTEGAALRRDHPRSWRAFLELELEAPHAPLYEHLEGFIRNGGGDAFSVAFGMDGIRYGEEHEDYRFAFDDAMACLSVNEIPAIFEHLDLPKFDCIVDIGGGKGELLSHIATLSGVSARLIVQDLPEAFAGVEVDSIEFVAMDVFESIVPGADCYLLKHIFEGFDNEQSLAVLRNVYAAAPTDATIAIIESVIAPPDVPNFGKLLDMQMILYGGGRSRTETELTQLLRQAEFKLVNSTSTEDGVYVIETRK